jgi:hypothetical protein
MRFLSVALCLWVAGTQSAVLGRPTKGSSYYAVANLPLRTAPLPRAADPASAEFAPIILDEKLQSRQVIDGYWLNDLSGKGIAAFNPNPTTYKVFRNVKDYGAKGRPFIIRYGPG